MIMPNISIGSGFPDHLDKLTIDAKYIVVAKCTAGGHSDGQLSWVTLEVTKVIKAPKSDPSPKILRVKGMTSRANRFNFFIGKRFFVFIDANGRADRQGSVTMVEDNGKLSYTLSELICLAPNTDTVKELIEQVRSVLSGEYEKRLIKVIRNRNLKPSTRRKCAIAMARTFPSRAVKLLAFLIEDLCYVQLNDGSAMDICMALARLSPRETALLWFKLCRKQLPHPYVFYYDLTYIVGDKGIQIPKLQDHLSDVIAMYNAWNKTHSGETPAAYLLPIFAKNSCRSKEVQDIVMKTLSQDEVVHVAKVFSSIAILNFPESVPLFWNHLRRLKSKNYEGSNNIPHQFVSAVMVYKGGAGALAAAKASLLRKFPELKGNLSSEAPICMGSGWYFLTKKSRHGTHSIYFVARCHDKTSGPRKIWTYKYVPIRLIGQKQGWNRKKM